MTTTVLELSIEKFIAATNKRCKQVEDWQDIEHSNLELEVSNAVLRYLRKSGYDNVWAVPLKKIVAADGELLLLLELDGLVAAEMKGKSLLATIEAKHKVTTANIDNRNTQNGKFQALLTKLQTSTAADIKAEGAARPHVDCCAVLQQYADAEVQHFLGGMHFSEPDANYARKKKFNIVTREGNAFRVTTTRVDVPV